MRLLLLFSILAVGCGDGFGRHGFGNGSQDLATSSGNRDLGSGNGGQAGCGELQGCYTVWAHGDHILYHVDLASKMLVTVGPFKAPMVTDRTGRMSEDVITDLAVASDDTIYVISKTNLYTADPKDGHVTLIGPVTACGTYAVALTFVPDGSLYAADFKGAFCKIDASKRPPTVTQIGMIGNNMAIAGDLVAVEDGTMYGTAYNLSDGPNMGTQIDNVLVKIDPQTGTIKQTIGSTGFPKLFGIAFAQGKVFGFTHDKSGNVITIDPKTGKGTLYNQFNDPATAMGISFAGAGVNSMVPAPPIM